MTEPKPLLTSHEPATGAPLWSGETADVDEAVARARAGFLPWASRAFTYRTETLRRFANELRSELAAFADLIARETGKPLWEATTEVEAVMRKVDISVQSYAERTPQRRLEGAIGAKSAVRHKPHGVLAVLGPYNFPAHLPNGHIVPALLAGNTVVFKPSEKTPAVGAKLVELFHRAGVPADALVLAQGGVEVGKALSAHRGIDGLLFTGSSTTGVALNRQFAERPGAILALEMGGNNPLVVWRPADVEAAAVLVIQSAFLTAGQRCTAARRLIVEDGAEQPLLDAVIRLMKRIIVGAPHDSPPPFMGPVIDNDTADNLQESFLALMMKGGQPLVQMERPDEGKPFLRPSLIDVTRVDRRPDVELFGPLLQLIRVKSFDEAIAEANATRFGLSASLIGGTPDDYDRFWASVRAGIINWNRPTNGASSYAPFGGVGLSGNHRPSAFYAADYCAYPVVSAEAEQARAAIGVGLSNPVGER